jgi:hypothetical protein
MRVKFSEIRHVNAIRAYGAALAPIRNHRGSCIVNPLVLVIREHSVHRGTNEAERVSDHWHPLMVCRPDNIFRTVAPIVIDVLKPPSESISPVADAEILAVWDEVRRGRAAPPGPFSFIQAVALTGVDMAAFPAGTVFLTLTPGGRHVSLWRSALDTLR